MLEFVMFFGEPDSKDAGSSRFACETHGQNAGMIQLLYHMHGQNAGDSSFYLRAQPSKCLNFQDFM